ncbi:MAG: hypothetical protein ABJM66_12230, partial [Nitratireductor sp.]
ELSSSRSSPVMIKGITGRPIAVAPSMLSAIILLSCNYIDELLLRHTSDRRTKSVHLRAEAAPVLERIEATAAAVRAQIFSDLSQAEVTTCLKVLEQIAGKLGGTPRAMRLADEDR